MKQSLKNKVFLVKLDETDSSFVKGIIYNVETLVLSVELSFGIRNFADVPIEIFADFTSAKSFGEFYNTNIKNKFKMAETKIEKRMPNKINRASNQKRFIKQKINLSKIKKEWLFKSEKTGDVFLDVTLMMLPDGETDAYGNLGMIVQTVPDDVYKKNKEAKGEILGNGQELEWTPREEENLTRLSSTDTNIMDDLPF